MDFSSDSYNEDDTRHYLHERNDAMDWYSEATHENGCLEFTLNTSQAGLTTTEGESSAVWAQLAESDARVMGKTFTKTLYL